MLLISGRLIGRTIPMGSTIRSPSRPLTTGGSRSRPRSGSPDRIYLTYASSPEERFFGFGTQFTYFDMKGRIVPILIRSRA